MTIQKGGLPPIRYAPCVSCDERTTEGRVCDQRFTRKLVRVGGKNSGRQAARWVCAKCGATAVKITQLGQVVGLTHPHEDFVR